MAEEEGGAEDTSFLRTVSIVAAILLYSILPDIMPSWATVLLELTSFTARLCSPLTVGGITAEDINVFTLASQNTE